MSLPQLVIFHGGFGGSLVEQMLAGALAEDTLDALEKVSTSGGIDGAILVTDHPEIAERSPVQVVVDADDGPFHFGERLNSIISRYRLERLIYLGAGAAPLIQEEEFFSMGHYLSMAWNNCVTNNFYSSDLVAFVPGEALSRVEPPESDNSLARVLRDQAGLDTQDLPNSTATQFDIDSPGDLAILKLVGAPGKRLQAWLEGVDFDLSRYQESLRLFTDRDAEVLVAGRAGSRVWEHLEKSTACRVRFISEERGMHASGRERQGRPRSFLGYHLEQVGCRRFFEEIAEMCDAAFIDTRVLLAHFCGHPSRADRFFSDMGRHEDIEDAFLREFTEEALKARVPVILGGHSLVSGGLMALIEAAWREHDRPPNVVDLR